jgi:hypothetical protein
MYIQIIMTTWLVFDVIKSSIYFKEQNDNKQYTTVYHRLDEEERLL